MSGERWYPSILAGRFTTLREALIALGVDAAAADAALRRPLCGRDHAEVPICGPDGQPELAQAICYPGIGDSSDPFFREPHVLGSRGLLWLACASVSEAELRVRELVASGALDASSRCVFVRLPPDA